MNGRRGINTVALLIFFACAERDAAPSSDSVATNVVDTPASAISDGPVWTVAPLASAPDRFRPGAWSDENVLWGLVRGRLTKLDTQSGEANTLSHDAWSIHGGSGAVAWRNARGAWALRDGDSPALVASSAGSDGPGTLLWSPDGSQLLMSWPAEWDAAYDLVARDGSKRRLNTSLPDFSGNDAALWLDSARVLFHVDAKGPHGGKPEYRESGWRGDLAVLDVLTGDYRRVTSVPDTVTLRVSGLHEDGVLVTERGPEGVRGFWVYDTRTWQRRAVRLPKGRAFSSAGGAVVVLLDARGDSTMAVLVSGGSSKKLGSVALDGEPAFTPSGARGAMRTAGGVVVFEKP